MLPQYTLKRCLQYGNYDNVIKQKVKKGYKTCEKRCSKLLFLRL